MSSTASRFSVFLAAAGLSFTGVQASYAAWPESVDQQIIVNTGNSLIDIGSVPDGAGGVIVVYQANGAGAGNRDILARRYNNSGDLAWPGGTLTVCNAIGDQSDIYVVPGLDGGCFVLWTDRRSADADIYAQKITAAGDTLFSPNGSPFLLAAGNQELEHAISDGFGGFIFAYQSGVLLTARRHGPAGVALWGAGATISAVAGDEISDMISDGAGGCVVGLERVGIGSEVVVMKISPTGGTDFDQLLSGNAAGNQLGIKLALRPNGNVLAVWLDGSVLPVRLVANEFVHPLVFNSNSVLPTGPGSVNGGFELIPSNFGDPILVYAFNTSGAIYNTKLARVTATGQLTMDTFLLGLGDTQFPDNVMELPTGEIRVTYTDISNPIDQRIMAAQYLSDGQFDWNLPVTPSNGAFKFTGNARLIHGSQDSLIVFSDQVLIPGGNTRALIRVRENGTIGGEVFQPDLNYGIGTLNRQRKSKKLNLFGEVVIRNNGTIPSLPTNVTFLASPSPGLVSTGMAFLFELQVPALQPGEQFAFTPGQLPPKKPGKKPKARKIKLPKDIKTIQYYMLIVLDSANANLETNEDNNIQVHGPL